jgi:Ca2+-binding EF-hand superfamily protein
MGYLPFYGKTAQEHIRAIASGKIYIDTQRSNHLSKDCMSFVKRLLVRDPLSRLSLQGAMRHPWLQPMQSRAGGAGLEYQSVSDLMRYAGMSKLRRSVLQLMTLSLTSRETKLLREVFLQLDTSCSGAISLPDLQRELQARFELPADRVGSLFAAMDIDGDGKICYSEFLAATMSEKVWEDTSLIRDAFNRFDKDNSGGITESELRQVLGLYAPARKVLQQLDVDQDGVISYNEFVAFITGEDAVRRSSTDEGACRGGLEEWVHSDQRWSPDLRWRSDTQCSSSSGGRCTPRFQMRSPRHHAMCQEHYPPKFCLDRSDWEPPKLSWESLGVADRLQASATGLLSSVLGCCASQRGQQEDHSASVLMPEGRMFSEMLAARSPRTHRWNGNCH